MNQNRILFLVSSASQVRLELAAGSEVTFANSFTPQLAQHPWQIVFIEDVVWNDAEVLPYRDQGLPIIALTDSFFTSAEVFAFRTKGAKKLYGIRTAEEVAKLHSGLAIEVRRFNRTGEIIPIPTKAPKGTMVGASLGATHLNFSKERLAGMLWQWKKKQRAS